MNTLDGDNSLPHRLERETLRLYDDDKELVRTTFRKYGYARTVAIIQYLKTHPSTRKGGDPLTQA